jgi:hypothetical protein
MDEIALLGRNDEQQLVRLWSAHDDVPACVRRAASRPER